MALTYTPDTHPGMICPIFKLPSIDGDYFDNTLFHEQRGVLFAFICNHCPYVKAVEDRLITLAAELAPLKVRFVGVCSNDTADYPEDSRENLLNRWSEKRMEFVYLHDEKQTLARSMGAVCTPDFFLFDDKQKLFYRGRLDDAWKNPSQVTSRDLFSAAQLMLKGEPAPSKQIPSMGCSIKWLKE